MSTAAETETDLPFVLEGTAEQRFMLMLLERVERLEDQLKAVEVRVNPGRHPLMRCADVARTFKAAFFRVHCMPEAAREARDIIASHPDVGRTMCFGFRSAGSWVMQSLVEFKETSLPSRLGEDLCRKLGDRAAPVDGAAVLWTGITETRSMFLDSMCTNTTFLYYAFHICAAIHGRTELRGFACDLNQGWVTKPGYLGAPIPEISWDCEIDRVLFHRPAIMPWMPPPYPIERTAQYGTRTDDAGPAR